MKPWYKSKTIWLNLAMGTVGALAETMPAVKELIPGWYALYAIAVALVNVWLRVISTAEISS